MTSCTFKKSIIPYLGTWQQLKGLRLRDYRHILTNIKPDYLIDKELDMNIDTMSHELIQMKDELELWQFSTLDRGCESACNECEHFVSHNYRAARTHGDPLDCHEEEGDFECEGEGSTCPIVKFDEVSQDMITDEFYLDALITDERCQDLIVDAIRGGVNSVNALVAWVYKMDVTQGDYNGAD